MIFFSSEILLKICDFPCEDISFCLGKHLRVVSLVLAIDGHKSLNSLSVNNEANFFIKPLIR